MADKEFWKNISKLKTNISGLTQYTITWNVLRYLPNYKIGKATPQQHGTLQEMKKNLSLIWTDTKYFHTVGGNKNSILCAVLNY